MGLLAALLANRGVVAVPKEVSMTHVGNYSLNIFASLERNNLCSF